MESQELKEGERPNITLNGIDTNTFFTVPKKVTSPVKLVVNDIFKADYEDIYHLFNLMKLLKKGKHESFIVTAPQNILRRREPSKKEDTSLD